MPSNKAVYDLKMSQEQNNNQESKSTTLNVELTKLKGVEGVDIREFNMKDTNIEVVETKMSTRNTANGVEENYFIQIQSAPLTEKGLRATTFISLWKDENDELCYSKNPNSNASKILNYFKVDSFEKLKGLKAQTIVRINSNMKEKLEIYFGQ